MSKFIAVFAALGLAGCYQQYYVADLHASGDGLVMTKCAVHDRWLCHDEVVDGTDDGTDVGTDSVTSTPDPAEIRKVGRQLAAAQPAPRSAPTDETIAAAVSASGVHRLMELCRTSYGKDVTAFHVSLTVAPSGEITDTPRDAVDPKFAECASRALRTANIAAFDGATVQSDQAIAL